jgi:PAS domain S-box-containing protein
MPNAQLPITEPLDVLHVTDQGYISFEKLILFDSSLSKRVTLKIVTVNLPCKVMTGLTTETQESKQAAPLSTFFAIDDDCWRDWADLVPVMLWIADAESGCNYFNLRWREFTGLTEEQLSVSGWVSNIHPEDLDAWEQTYLNAWNLNSKFQREYRFKRADGEYRWIEEIAVPKLTPEGKFQGLIATATDISDRKNTEIALAQATQILESSLNRFDLAVNTSFDGIWDAPIVPEDVFNPQNPVYWSPRFKQLLGYKDNEFENVLGSWISRLHPDDKNRVLEAIAAHLEQNIPFKNIEYRLRRKSGEYIWLAARGQALWDKNGTPVRFAGSIQDITESKKNAEELLEYQRKLEQNQRIAHIGNWEFDLATGNIIWSDELKRIFGLEINQPAPTYPEFLQKIHPHDREGFQQTVDQAIALRQSYEIDHRICCSNGEIRYLIGWGQILQNKQGEVVKLFGTAIDITDRKQAELALQVSQESLHTVINNAPVILFSIDCNGIFTFSEGKGLEFLGLKPGEAVGQSVYELYKDDPQLIENINLVLTGEARTWLGEFNDHIYENRAQSILDEKGKVSGLIGVSIDITERARVAATVRESEARLRLILENMPVMLSAVDADRNIIVWNRECEQVLGYSASEIVGNVQAIQRLIPHVDYRQKIFKEIIKGGNNFRDLEVELQAADGSIKTIAWSNISADFSVPGWDFWGIGVDVTNRKVAELALRESEAQLREQAAELEIAFHKLSNTQAQLVQSEKMSSLGQLVAGVAHEINNPVSFIFGNINYAKDYTNDLLKILELYRAATPEPTPEIKAQLQESDLDFIKEDLPKLLDSMEVGANRIQEIVKSLRTFSRLDEAIFKMVDLHEGIDSTLMILAHRLKPQGDYLGISIIKEYGNLPQVECYSGQLNQVFMNLLSNAIDALEEGASIVKSASDTSSISTIKIRTEVIPGERVRIAIADNGVGISESVQQRLFDPFFTTKPVGKGTGLGLAISYEIVVKKHQGELLCHSELGVGTEFAIEIPLCQPQVA